MDPVTARKIWIDLENTPHIPFFFPIIRELRARGWDVVVTARDAFQTCEMATRFGLQYEKIGHHYGQRPARKAAGLVIRSLQLLPFALRERPALALNHGSRAQNVIGNLLRIPTVMIMDYEHSRMPPLVRPKWEIVPDAISPMAAHCSHPSRVRTFGGIKEDVYVPDFVPDAALMDALGLREKLVVTVRPPATEAHYHNPESEALFVAFMARALTVADARIVLLPRNSAQRDTIHNQHPDWFADERVIVPGAVVDGLNLLWHSDLVISGGGTMNREAAALGVPVYSIFRGKVGAVDRRLAANGRLVMIQSVAEITTRIPIVRRVKRCVGNARRSAALEDVISHVVSILESETRVR